MIESLSGLMDGFGIAFQPTNLFFCFLGCFVGTMIGVLPGIGPTGTLALLLPITFYLPPATAIIMLSGIFYGAMYGGSTTAILVNIPGEAASLVTCLDGYQMARKGRAGPALGISAMGSFIAGSLSVLALVFLAPPLAQFALRFSSPEYAMIVLFGLTLISYLGSGSKLKAFMMGAAGFLLGTIGADPMQSIERFTFGSFYLIDGVGLIPVVMGLFGISEIFLNLEEKELRTILQEKIKNIYPTIRDWIQSFWPLLRGTLIGFFVGVMPGGTTVIGATMSYAVEKRVSKEPEKFGTGAIEGVAGPESANNAAATGCFVPLLSLGIPTNAIMGLLLACFMIHGVIPGPLLIRQHPDLFWSITASMYVGNMMLLALNLPLIGLWVQILKVPYSYLFPFLFLFCVLGSYSLKNTVFDVGVMIFFGAVGFLMKKFEYEPAPFILAFLLGPLFEEHARRSLMMSYGSFSIFLERPISLAFVLLTLLVLFSPLFWRPGEKKVPARPGE